MSLPGWRTVLVLGGVGAYRSEFARSLLAGSAEIRTTSADGDGADGGLAGLARVLTRARPGETLLVDGLDAWLAGDNRAGRGGETGTDETGTDEAVSGLVTAIRRSGARVVLVSPEVGLSPPPTTATARDRTAALAGLNRTVAEAVDAVVLVVAGQPVWLKGGTGPQGGPGLPHHVTGRGRSRPVGAAGAAPLDLANLGWLPQPDEPARDAAGLRLAGAGLGTLAEVASFAAATQARVEPLPWRTARMLVLRGDHQGAAAAGALGSSGLAARLRDGTGPLARLAADTAAQVDLVEVAAAAPIEEGPALAEEAVDHALAHGWRLAEQASGEDVDVLLLGSIGDGAETAAAAVAAALGGVSTEPASLLGRVRAADGTIDDDAWISRCAAVRDAVHRTATASRTAARAVLAALGGADIATATGIILGAAAHRTPVLLDGPVGAAALLVAKTLVPLIRRWCLLPDHGGHPTVVRAAEVLGLTPLLDLKLELGEGAACLVALPVLRSALTLTLTGSVTAPPPHTPVDQGETHAN